MLKKILSVMLCMTVLFPLTAQKKWTEDQLADKIVEFGKYFRLSYLLLLGGPHKTLALSEITESMDFHLLATSRMAAEINANTGIIKEYLSPKYDLFHHYEKFLLLSTKLKSQKKIYETLHSKCQPTVCAVHTDMSQKSNIKKFRRYLQDITEMHLCAAHISKDINFLRKAVGFKTKYPILGLGKQ